MASTPVAPGVAALAVLVAACGAKTDLVPDCDSAAIGYCQANGCPELGPPTGTTASLGLYCAASPSFAPRVAGIGTCLTPSGQTWAIDVKSLDASGASVYLLYDPTSGQLIGVTTFEPTGDGGTSERDYGSCGAGLGIISCETTLLPCP